uniref:Putative Sugar Porter n=1 Tax=Yarrowia alimentaria TaxID=479092 RepID=A0A1N6MBW4_9ASCO|nr:putative Sugar Porter [Yarrowia alimentaria]
MRNWLAFSQSSTEVKTEFLGLRGQKLHRAVAFIAGMGFLLFGYDQGVMGGLLTLPRFVQQFPKMNTSSDLPEDTRKFNTTIQGTSVGIYEIGCMLGALFTMWAGDKLGRRRMIFWGSIIMTIGAILQCASYSLGQFITGRVVSGIGNGFITATVPMFQSECAKPERRGALVMMEGALITGGIALSYWIDFGFYWVNNDADWRFPIAFQIIFSMFLTFTVMSLPESPRWLVKKQRFDEAAGVFSALEDVPLDDPYVIDQITEVKESIMMEQLAQLGVDGSAAREKITSGEFQMGAELPFLKQMGLMFTFGKKKNFHRTMLAYWNQVMQQITGINLITYYAAYIYETSVGMNATNSRILAACNGTEYFLASWVAFYTIERFGRRKLMLFGAVGQAATMAILTGTVYAASPVEDGGLDKSGAGVAAAVFLFVFNTFFAIGWLGMTWLYPAEITSLEIRAPANGLSTSGNWIFNFMVVMITPVAFDTIKWKTYIIFACLNAAMVPVVYFFYPETAGRSLEEIDKIFAESNPRTPWDVVGIARRMPRESALTRRALGNQDVYATNTSEKAHVEESTESNVGSTTGSFVGNSQENVSHA